MLLKLIGFKGELPSVQPRSLPDASKTYLYGVSIPDGRMVFAPHNATAQTPQPRDSRSDPAYFST